jgi:hypothetical protein
MFVLNFLNCHQKVQYLLREIILHIDTHLMAFKTPIDPLNQTPSIFQ